jgi:hypothetical protein
MVPLLLLFFFSGLGLYCSDGNALGRYGQRARRRTQRGETRAQGGGGGMHTERRAAARTAAAGEGGDVVSAFLPFRRGFSSCSHLGGFASGGSPVRIGFDGLGQRDRI